VSQLLDERGVLLSYEHFMQEFSFPVPPREYAIVFGAIPDCVKPLVNSGLKGPLTSPPMCNPAVEWSLYECLNLWVLKLTIL